MIDRQVVLDTAKGLGITLDDSQLANLCSADTLATAIAEMLEIEAKSKDVVLVEGSLEAFAVGKNWQRINALKHDVDNVRKDLANVADRETRLFKSLRERAADLHRELQTKDRDLIPILKEYLKNQDFFVRSIKSDDTMIRLETTQVTCR